MDISVIINLRLFFYKINIRLSKNKKVRLWKMKGPSLENERSVFGKKNVRLWKEKSPSLENEESILQKFIFAKNKKSSSLKKKYPLCKNKKICLLKV